MRVFAERARRELMATGREGAQRQDDTRDELTQKEEKDSEGLET